jgi:hypothetical protein
MKRWIAPLVALLIVGMLGVSSAQAANPDKKKKKGGDGGVIEKIDGSGNALTLTVAMGHGKKATKVNVTTDDKTTVTVDGQTKDLKALKAGYQVKLDSTSGTVKTIDASTAASDAKGKAKGEKKKKKKAA